MKFDDLINQLESAGFFNFVEGGQAAVVKQEMLNCQHKYLFPEFVGRSFFADAEDLAEGGALGFVATIVPCLAQLGVHLPVTTVALRTVKQRDPKTGELIDVARTKLQIDDSIPDEAGTTFIRPISEDMPQSGDYYRVTIGDRTDEIWNNEMSGVQMWEAGMCHTFMLVNEVLSDAGASERLYGMYGGNDGQAIFLTPKQFELIRQCEDIEEREKPWTPYRVR